MEPEDRDHLRNVIIDAGHVLSTARYFASVKAGPTDPLVQRIAAIREQVNALREELDPEE